MIAALSRAFVNSVQSFALCPVDSNKTNDTISIQAWAKLEFCKIYSSPEDLERLSRVTIWTNEFLQNLVSERYKLFLICLRIYQLYQPVELQASRIASNKIGSFIKLSQGFYANSSQPILSDWSFQKRKQQLIRLESPSHPELEELHSKISKLEQIHPVAKYLIQDIQAFLDWQNTPDMSTSSFYSDLDWINTIDELGNRSKEQDDDKKSNYQAGTDFENIVRKSLEFLGFTVDEAYRGGAGGLDLYCSKPYPLTGECKAGKKIPSGTTEELVKLGGMRLKPTSLFLESAKLIIGPGNPTPDVLLAAKNWKVSIIKPMTLQKLVELKAKHPGSINLIELKEYLEPGQIDYKIEEYVDKVLKELQVRQQIIQSVKEVLNDEERIEKDCTAVEVRAHYNAKYQPRLNDGKTRDILVELSSPLAGYLGRNEEANRFYFLRDLIID